MTLTEQKVAAKKFATKWADRGDEKQDTRAFWEEFMEDVLGIEGARDIIETEYPVEINGHQKYIDVFYKNQKILIEQKSAGKSLKKKYPQSGGEMLTPYDQARRYAGYLAYDEKARWIIVCNFQQFEIHDLKKPSEEPFVISLEDLSKQIGIFNFFISDNVEDIRRETEISKDAGDVVGLLYDALKEKYVDPDNEETQRHLNVLVTRLVFCMYAEDAGLFGDEPNRFLNYIKNKEPEDLGEALERLFRILDMPTAERNKKSNIPQTLKAFPYVNGGLFKEEDIEIPVFDDSLKKILVDDACAFNWSDISPTIFGAVFESTLNPETRRSGGMHYTSIENIHKVIDPLFLDDLRKELREIQATADTSYYKQRLLKYQDKLASLKFLDPACGSGNFLTESYLCLRKLENIVFSELIAKKQIEGQMAIAGIDDSVYQDIKVSISQFYGIEINDFAVTVAKTALWIAEAQMYEETRKIFFQAQQSLPDFFPLTTNATIFEGNALRIDWNDVVDKNKLTYIMGNPPFIGSKKRTVSQREDVKKVIGTWNNAGNLDYVACWYKLASDYITDTNIKVALVSTNSITQGEEVAALWEPLTKDGVHIDFAHKTFQWDSEANIKAHVHCVIIGFSKSNSDNIKYIYSDDEVETAQHINGYLMNAEHVFLERRRHPLCNVPEIIMGPMSLSGNHLILTKEEKDRILSKEPQAVPWIRRFSMGKEFIDGSERYCLWLKGISPKELKSLPLVMEHVQACKEYRESSKKTGDAYKYKDTPHLFRPAGKFNEDIPYFAMPQTSSENRQYIPMDFVTNRMIPGQKLYIIPEAGLYLFGILTSIAHMAWTRAVCGRLEMRYSYSVFIVYNNYPWPELSDSKKELIEKTAQGIIDARNLYPDCSLADLYNETVMPIELRRAHQANDLAVLDAYGFYHEDDKGKKTWFTEEEIVAALMRMYQKLTQPNEVPTQKKEKAPLKVKIHKKK